VAINSSSRTLLTYAFFHMGNLFCLFKVIPLSLISGKEAAKIDFLELGRGYIVCIGLAQDRNRSRVLVNSVLNFRAP
jgi:hypothetical protein